MSTSNTIKSLVRKSKSQLEKINKKDLIDIISGSKEFETILSEEENDVSFNSACLNPSVEQRLNDFKKQLDQMETNIISALTQDNQRLVGRIDELESVNCNLIKRIVQLETNHWETNQYNRRNNIEIAGIPDEVNNDQLQVKVSEILEKIDVHVNANEIQTCHRLKNSRNENTKKLPRRTIVKKIIIIIIIIIHIYSG